MSRRTYLGSAPGSTAQVWNGTITDNTAGSTYTLTITDELGNTVTSVYTIVSGDSSLTIAAASIATLFNSTAKQLDPRIGAISASSNTATVILTARTAGVPFTVAGTGGGTGPGAWTGTGNTVSNVGPNDANCPSNYAEGIVPVAADSITLSAGQILYGLQQGAVWTGPIVAMTGFIGAGRPGYRLKMTPSAFTWSVNGSQTPSFLDLNSANIAAYVNSTASIQGGAGLDVIGSNLASLTVNNGSVASAIGAGETATIATLTQTGGAVTDGSGLTLTTHTMTNGTATVYCAATTLTLSGGTCTTRGTGAMMTVNVTSTASFVPNSSGTITTLNTLGGNTDFTQSDVARTVTSWTYGAPAVVSYGKAVVTFTNGPQGASGLGNVKLTTVAA